MNLPCCVSVRLPCDLRKGSSVLRTPELPSGVSTHPGVRHRLAAAAVRSRSSPRTRETQTQRFSCAELSLRHFTPFFLLCLSLLPWLLLTLRRLAFPPSHLRPGGAVGERMVGSRALHGGGVHQREAGHRREHPAGDRLHQQGLVRRTRGGRGGESLDRGCQHCARCFLSLFPSKSCSIGMVLPLWSDTKIHLDGDG